MSMHAGKRVIISGGGTGGHIFPAIAIAHALKRLEPRTEILFVGALGRMEMEKVPAAGFDIVGLDIQGINRQAIWKNWNLPFKLWKSMRKARAILKEFQPDVAVGVGGYASGPLLLAAKAKSVPYLIQEQNSYAGITNKRLGKHAQKICVAFEGMDRFFPADKIQLTGNPIRPETVHILGKREEAYAHFGLKPDRRTLLVTGGSLGARTLNESIQSGLDQLVQAGVQVIWQCGSYYYENLRRSGVEARYEGVRLLPFLQRMDLAYAAADLIISRAGAGTIAELYAVGKPIILVPSPNVAEDHQTQNALSLVKEGAAELVPDADARQHLVQKALQLFADPTQCALMGAQLTRLARWDADEVIAKEVILIAEKFRR